MSCGMSMARRALQAGAVALALLASVSACTEPKQVPRPPQSASPEASPSPSTTVIVDVVPMTDDGEEDNGVIGPDNIQVP